MKKYYSRIDVTALVIALYVSLVWGAYFFLHITHRKSENIISLTVIFVGFYVVMKTVLNIIKRYELISVTIVKTKDKVVVFLITVFLAIGIMLIWISAYYPGSFSPDSIVQYGQALSGDYNDWHPVWHTIVFFTLPLKIFGNPVAIIILQNIYFSLLMGYLALTVYEIGNIKIAFLSVFFILLNPYTGYIMLYPWKDVGFALAGLFCTVFSVRLVVIKKNTKKIWKLIVFGIVMASATIFRHNAILYTGPLIGALFLKIDRNTWKKIILFTMLAFFVIKVPIYESLNVEKPQKRVLESTGLPLTVIGNVVKETPDCLDDELAEFAYSLAPQELWQEKYSCGSFNSIKWAGVDITAVDKEGYAGMLKLMVKCFKVSPGASWNAFVSLTDIVYGFENGLEGNVKTEIADNDYGIAYSTNSGRLATIFREFISNYSDFINSTIFKYFRTYGVCLLVIIVVFAGKLNLKSWNSWKKVFMAVPLLAYDYGTMLLLTGPDSRFFFITFLVTPLLIVYALCKGEI